MDPASQSTPSFEMPPAPRTGETAAGAPEQAPLAESAPLPQAPPLSAPSMPLPTINPSMYAAPASAPAPQGMQTPAVADDIDLIEKEWVDKAKAIVNSTRNDPHSQNDEMNRFKADYMKKRYNKDIKLSEA